MTKRPTLSILLAVAACGDRPAPAPETAPGPLPSSSDVSAASTESAAEPAAATSAPTPSPFKVVGELPAAVRLFGVGERGFVAFTVGHCLFPRRRQRHPRPAAPARHQRGSQCFR